MSLLALSNRLKGVDLNKILDQLLNDLLPEIIDRVTEQLESGDFGGKYYDTYSPISGERYMKAKAAMGVYDLSIAPKINLKYTGAFYDGFYAIVKEYMIEIGSNDSKASMLENDYTDYIYGLGMDGMDWLRDEIRPQLVELLKKELQV